MKIFPNEVAFPADSRESGTFKGLTKLEYFSIKMLQSLRISSTSTNEQMAKEAIELAYVLMKELSKENKY